MATPAQEFVMQYAPLLTAAGTVTGALTGGLVNWFGGQATSKKNRSLDLAIEFWSPGMIEHRNRVWKRRGEILSQESADACAIVNFYNAIRDDDPLFLSFMILLGFYQKVTKQAVQSRLVRRVFVDQIKSEFERFHTEIIKPGFAGLTKNDREDWVTAHDELEVLSEWLR